LSWFVVSFLLALVLFASDPPVARALDFFGGGGQGGAPVTGWNGNTDTRARHVKVPCGTTKSFTAQFNAKLTQADINAGGFIIKIVDGEWDGDHQLLKTTATCAKLVAKGVGTEVVGEVKFTLKCTDGCIIEGVSIDRVTIHEMPPGTALLCSVASPATETGSTGDSSADLALEDDPVEGDNEYGANQLTYECDENVTAVQWVSADRAHTGEVVTVELLAAAPIFTEETSIIAGIDRGILVLDLELVDPMRLRATLDIPAESRPGVIPVYIADTERAADVPPFHLDPVHWADHTLGDCVLTVTDAGALGFHQLVPPIGSGFSHPRDTENQLCVGSFWVGADPEYVANRDYMDDPTSEWAVVGDGHPNPNWVTFESYGPLEEILRTVYDDGAAERPRGIHVEQVSSSVLDNPFVILRYRITNTSPAPLRGLFAGVFADFDVPDDPYSNYGATDPAAGLAWMSDGGGRYDAVLALPSPEWPAPIANVTMIPNQIYIWPAQHMADQDKFAFLAAADADHVFPEAQDPDDWSALVSFGPFDLVPGETREVAFALLGGEGLDGIMAAAELARLFFTEGISGTGEPPASASAGKPGELRVLRNPFSSETQVELRLPARGGIDLSVFDVRGRWLRNLAHGLREAGEYTVAWDGRTATGRDVPAGTYFLRLQVDGGGPRLTRTERVTRMR